jgi:aryl-alcohol dehydrogenase-like predicted oxidoreductase
MDLRKLGNSGLKVSAIGLGANTFGRTVDGDEAIAVIRRALDSGINFIDTADIYSFGRSEELIGQAIAGRRPEVILATKCGMAMSDDPYQRGLSRRWIMRAMDASLRRLGTDYVDLYQAHLPDADTPLEESLRAMDDLVRQGKTRYVGCSNYAAWQLAQAHGICAQQGLARWISAQNAWNLVDGLEDPSLPTACDALGIGIIPFTPLASGILTGKYRRGEAPPAGTRAADLPNVRQRYLTDNRLAAVERLRPWAESRGHGPAELAVAWLLSQPAVSTVIIGARTAEQVEANAKMAGWTLSGEELGEVNALARG